MSEVRGEADIVDQTALDIIDDENRQRERRTSRTLPDSDDDERSTASPGVPVSRRVSLAPEGYNPPLLLRNFPPLDSGDDDEAENGNNKTVSNDDDTRCGFLGLWTPAFLQPLANTKVFVLLYVFQDIFRSMFFSYWTSSISTVEKRYRLPSKWVGSFSALGEGGKLVCVLLFAHFGGRGHRPRWMAFACLCVAMAAITLVVPETFVPLPSQADLADFQRNATAGGAKYSAAKRRAVEEMCQGDVAPYNSSNNTQQCDSSITQQQTAANNRQQTALNTKVWWAIGLFVLGHTFMDAGSGIPRTIGVPFIYDNVKLSATPLYYACLYAGRVIGPLSGYILGSLTSRIYVDPSNPPEGVGLDDPQWIGAWYLGFIGIFVGEVIASCLFLWFPRRVRRSPSTKTITSAKLLNNNSTMEINRNTKKLSIAEPNSVNAKRRRYGEKGRQVSDTHHSKKARLSDLPHDLLHLLKNPFILFIIFGRAIDVLGSAGFRHLTPKFLENHFRVTTSKANVFTGISTVLAYATSGLIGAFMIKRFNFQPRHIGLVMLVTQTIMAFGTMSLAMFSCDGPRMAGQVAPNHPFDINSTCSSSCRCVDAAFTPVCDRASGINYFSPCRAGCTQRSLMAFDVEQQLNSNYATIASPENGSKFLEIYTNCSCLSDPSVMLTRGYCRNAGQSQDASPCDSAFYWYNVVKTALAFVGGLPSVGGIMLLFRMVEPELKSLATALLSFTATLMGFLPGSYIAGSILDSTCILWNKGGGGGGAAKLAAVACAAAVGASQSGLSNCLLYDNETLRLRFHFFVGILRTFGLLFDAASLWWVWNIKFHVAPEEETMTKDDERVSELLKNSNK